MLDTYAWIEFFQGSKEGSKVEQLVVNETCFTSSISLAELVEWCLKNNFGPEQYLNSIKKASIIIDLSESILELAGKINFDRKKEVKDWGLVDSIIFSTAKIHDLKIVTGDKHFKDIESVLFL